MESIIARLEPEPTQVLPISLMVELDGGRNSPSSTEVPNITSELIAEPADMMRNIKNKIKMSK